MRFNKRFVEYKYVFLDSRSQVSLITTNLFDTISLTCSYETNITNKILKGISNHKIACTDTIDLDIRLSDNFFTRVKFFIVQEQLSLSASILLGIEFFISNGFNIDFKNRQVTVNASQIPLLYKKRPLKRLLIITSYLSKAEKIPKNYVMHRAQDNCFNMSNICF